MSTYLYRLARWCFRHRWATMASWLVVVAAAVVIGMASGGKTTDGVTIPGTESQQVVNVLKQKLPAASGASTQVVFATTGADITGANYQKAIEDTVKDLGRLPQVATCRSSCWRSRSACPATTRSSWSQGSRSTSPAPATHAARR